MVQIFAAPQPTPDNRVIYALRAIDSRFTDPNLTVVRLAKEVRLSPSQLRRLMKSRTGASPKRRILERRFRLAKQLLETTFLSVKEVMAAVGVRDATQFSKAFKRSCGLSPTEHRRANCYCNNLRRPALSCAREIAYECSILPRESAWQPLQTHGTLGEHNRR